MILSEEQIDTRLVSLQLLWQAYVPFHVNKTVTSEMFKYINMSSSYVHLLMLCAFTVIVGL